MSLLRQACHIAIAYVSFPPSLSVEYSCRKSCMNTRICEILPSARVLVIHWWVRILRSLPELGLAYIRNERKSLGSPHSAFGCYMPQSQ